jgi:hypothetical protein
MGADAEIELRGGGSILPHAAHRAGHQQDVLMCNLGICLMKQGRVLKGEDVAVAFTGSRVALARCRLATVSLGWGTHFFHQILVISPVTESEYGWMDAVMQTTTETDVPHLIRKDPLQSLPVTDMWDRCQHPEDQVFPHASSKSKQGAERASTHCHVSCSFGPYLPAELGFKAATYPTALELTSLLR